METSFSSLLVSFMVDVAILAGVPLAIATLSGFLVSFLQAITQIQDQTLSQTVKITAIALTLLFFGTMLTGPLLVSTQTLFDTFPQIVR